jgi:hypothetical protein
MKPKIFPGPIAPLADVLPPEFDGDSVSSFFKTSAFGRTRSEQVRSETGKPEIGALDLSAYALDAEEDAIPGVEISREAREEREDDDDIRALPEASNALEALVAADETAEADLATLARPLRDAQTPPTTDSGADAVTDPLEGFAGAKPSWAGGNKDSSTDSGGGETETTTKGKGWGKTKDQQTEDSTSDPVTETDTGTTTDTTTETTTDTATGTTGDTSTGTTETNSGSTDPDVYVSGLDTPEGYNIEITFIGEWTDSLRIGLQNVAERISDLITGDIPEHNGIDDISISATLTDIDGSGGFWGWGGYTSVRPDSYLPSQGYMRFDTADAGKVDSYGLWEDLMLHEMLHAMGFGTAWSAMGLIEDYNGDLRFTGTNAIEAYNREFASIAESDPLSDLGVMVETDGGSGTAGVHWDHENFSNELMTGTLRTSNYLSDMSIAALEDMGYETIYESVTVA